MLKCYLCVGRTGVASPESCIAACVLQAETGLVSLGYFPSCPHVQQVVVTERVHAVVVPEEWTHSRYSGFVSVMDRRWTAARFLVVNSLVTAVPVPLIPWLDREEVRGTLVLHLLREPQQNPEVDVSHRRSVG